MLRVAPASAFGLGLALAVLVSAATGGCQGPDPYYRNADGGLRLDATGSAGSVGSSGKAGTSGSGKAGTGAGTAGTGAGAAGTGAAAAGTGGVITGAAGTAVPCTQCKVNVQYTCRSDDTKQASFVLNVTNNSTVSIALSDLTLRYWYSNEAGKAQALDCDFAALDCTNVSASANQAPAPMPRFEPVTPPRVKGTPPNQVVVANAYVEISFSLGAQALDPFLDTGEIQLRLHNTDNFSAINQEDDYSFDKTMKGNPIEGTKITAYVKGVLVWGTEPP